MGCFMKEFYIYSSLDNKKLCCIDFSENLKNPKIVLQICHGMAEHIRRYKDFALFLEKQGIRVFGMDNRGHGKTCEAEEEKGHIADKEGNIKLIEDVYDLNKYIKEQFSKNEHVKISADDAISKGGVVIISDGGNIDATMQTRLEKLKMLVNNE